MTFRTTVTLGLVVGAAMVIGVTGSATAHTDDARGALPVLRIGVGAVPIDLAKTGSVGFPVSTFGDLAYDGLFRQTAKGTIVPGLAVKWRYYSTGRGPNKDFEFTLRKTARFSDGSRVTAHAVVAWLNYFAKNGLNYSTFLGPNPRFEAVGNWVVRLHLRVPTPSLPLILSNNGWNAWGFVPSPKALANPISLSTGTHGAGPYMLDPSETVVGDHYTYVPNRYYFDKARIKWSKIFVKVVPNAVSMLQALQGGQIDVALGDISTADGARSSGLGVASALSQGINLLLNAKVHPALRDVRVRQAINYALDRNTVAAALLGRYGKPTSQFLVSDANPGLEKYYPYNPSRAKSLLAAAGYANGFTLKITDIPGLTDQVVRAFAPNLEAVGIHPVITPFISFAQWVSGDAVQSGANINITPPRFQSFLAPTAPYNFWGTDQTVYKLYYAGLKARDPIPSWKKMWARVTQQAYFAPLAAYHIIWYYNRNSVTGVGASVTTQRPSTVMFTDWSHK